MTNPASRRPRIAVTMGDPAGVGPELCLRVLADIEIACECVPIVFGDAGVLARVASATGLPAPAHILSREAWNALSNVPALPTVLDLEAIQADRVQPGIVGAHTGRAGFAYVMAAIDAALAGKVDAVATAPLNKEALHAAGVPFPGHTEIFAAHTRAARACMLQYSDAITCSFVTTHVGYRQVPELLTTERILDVIQMTAEALQRLQGRPPRLAVCGLNPHAGEHGLFGEREEERIIAPAIEAAQARGWSVEGPLPPDTAFLPAKRECTDAFVCMYHDQGHIPVKALAFESAVNTTLGLPIIRTSVDHGTACDIAWQGLAHSGSLFSAIRLAIRLLAD